MFRLASRFLQLLETRQCRGHDPAFPLVMLERANELWAAEAAVRSESRRAIA